jgi:hypothetical protein
LFNCVAATIKDRNQAKLKLECIAFDEGTIEHVDGMANRSHGLWNGPMKGSSPTWFPI